MKVKYLFSVSAFLFVVMLVTSCATTHPNEKMLVGTWYAQKASIKGEIRIPEDKLAAIKGSPTSADSLKNKKGGKSDKGGKGVASGTASSATPEQIEQFKKQKLDQLISAETKSKLKIMADHKAEKVYPGHTYTGKWKLKNNGTVLVAKTKEKGTVKMDIDLLNDSTLLVTEHLDYLDVSVKYKR